MKKKIFGMIMALFMAIPFGFMLASCGHTHTFSEEWSADATYHWHASTCEHENEKKDYAEHEFTDAKDETCNVCNYKREVDKNIYVGANKTLIQAIAEAQNGDTIVLTENVVVAQGVAIDKTLTIDLNGKTISNVTDIWVDTEDEDDWSLISVREGGNLTIKGNGIFKAKENDCYAIDVRGGKCIIENGTFIGNVSAVYAYEGEIEIKEGTFDIQQLHPKYDRIYTLNCYDANFRNGSAKITVSGGRFNGYNPNASTSEYPVAVFLKDGLTTQELAPDADGNSWFIVIEK